MFKDSMGNEWRTAEQRDAWDWFHSHGSETLREIGPGDERKGDSKAYDDAGGFDRPGVK